MSGAAWIVIAALVLALVLVLLGLRDLRADIAAARELDAAEQRREALARTLDAGGRPRLRVISGGKR